MEAVSSEGSAAINVEGKWVDPDSRRWNWGKGNLWQKEKKISGFIGIYNVRGIVSEKIAYLVFYSEGIVHYTAKLEMVEIGVLEGQYFEANDVEQKTGSFIRFIAKMN